MCTFSGYEFLCPQIRRGKFYCVPSGAIDKIGCAVGKKRLPITDLEGEIFSVVYCKLEVCKSETCALVVLDNRDNCVFSCQWVSISERRKAQFRRRINLNSQ
jgi:hypothetical protein